MRTTPRSLCRLSNLAFASALVALLGACGGGGGDVPTESPLAAGGPCKAKNESTGAQYMKSANPVGDAIAAATAGDTIRIWGVCYGNFVVNKNLTLQGQGAKATLDGGNSGTTLTVWTRVSATINDLTIAHGNATFGGGIYMNYGSTLTLTNSTVNGNTATSYGGGIHMGGNVTLRDSTVSDNASAYGGGIAGNYANRLELANSIVSGNTATYTGGGIWTSPGSGATVTVDNSIVTGNSAYGAGGIYSGHVLSLTGSTISGNTARISYGGGIANAGTLYVSDSTISGNAAAIRGGGIYNMGTLNLTGSAISGNTAQYGGGLYNYNSTATLVNSTVTSNAATYSGGGIYNWPGSTLNLTNSIVSDNTPDQIYPQP